MIRTVLVTNTLIVLIVFLTRVNVAYSLQCMSCKDVLQAEDCDRIEHCAADEFCYYHKGTGGPSDPSYRRVNMGCMGQLQCNAIKLAHSSYGSVVGCCNYDFCNSKDFGSHATLTTTLPTTTMFAATIAINAPTQAAYMTMVQLQCVSLPPAETYSWAFNGTIVLPAGVNSVQYASQPGAPSGIDVLTISQLTMITSGVYTCTGHIKGHTFESSHHIRIMPGTYPASITGK